MFAGLAALLDLTEAGLVGFVLVFARIGGVMTLLPGFGERLIPARVRLGLAIAFTLVVWPMLAPGLVTPAPGRPFLQIPLDVRRHRCPSPATVGRSNSPRTP